jgi:DNA methyltransferase 1-associated protein 1
MYLYLVEYNPIPTEDTVTHFNELRQDVVLLYELKIALATCDYELESLKHRFETLAPGKVLFSFRISLIFTVCSGPIPILL